MAPEYPAAFQRQLGDMQKSIGKLHDTTTDTKRIIEERIPEKLRERFALVENAAHPAPCAALGELKEKLASESGARAPVQKPKEPWYVRAIRRGLEHAVSAVMAAMLLWVGYVLWEAFRRGMGR